MQTTEGTSNVTCRNDNRNHTRDFRVEKRRSCLWRACAHVKFRDYLPAAEIVIVLELQLPGRLRKQLGAEIELHQELHGLALIQL